MIFAAEFALVEPVNEKTPESMISCFLISRSNSLYDGFPHSDPQRDAEALYEKVDKIKNIRKYNLYILVENILIPFSDKWIMDKSPVTVVCWKCNTEPPLGF